MSKQRPILFSTEMVKAILEGRKTQTRRVIKPFENLNNNAIVFKENAFPRFQFEARYQNIDWQLNCPYGKPGDVLWVRETYHKSEGTFPTTYLYKAVYGESYDVKWKPSIFMPKDAARIWLEITKVRVERLLDISEDDAFNEGVRYWTHDNDQQMLDAHFKDYRTGLRNLVSAHSSFLSLWESINGEESIHSNPWVWVIEFIQIPNP